MAADIDPAEQGNQSSHECPPRVGSQGSPASPTKGSIAEYAATPDFLMTVGLRRLKRLSGLERACFFESHEPFEAILVVVVLTFGDVIK